MFETFIQSYGDMIIRLILTVIGGGLASSLAACTAPM